MTTLHGLTWQNPRGYRPLVAAAEVWRRGHAGAGVVWEQLPWYDFEAELLEALAAGDGGYDLVMFDHPWVGKLASEAWLVPLDRLVDEGYLARLSERMVAPSVESYVWDERLWAFPLDAACHAALYRADLVDGDRLPQRWEEIESWVRAYHDPPGRYGVVLSLEGVLGNCLFMSMMAGLGYPPYLDRAAPTFDRAAAAYVLTQIKALIPYAPPGSTRWGPWDIFEQMARHSNVGYSPSIFAYVNYFEGLPHSGQLRLGLVPSVGGRETARPILGGVGLGITAACRSRPLAADYATFLAGDDVQRDIFPNASGQPAAAVAWDDPQLNRRFNGFYAALRENMRTAYIRPRYPSFHIIELRNGAVLQQWWDDRLGLAEVLDRLARIPRQLDV